MTDVLIPEYIVLLTDYEPIEEGRQQHLREILTASGVWGSECCGEVDPCWCGEIALNHDKRRGIEKNMMKANFKTSPPCNL